MTAKDKAKKELENLVNYFKRNENALMKGDSNEEEAILHYISPMFEVFGWDFNNKKRKDLNKMEVRAQRTFKSNSNHKDYRPDFNFNYNSGTVAFYLDAKAVPVKLKTHSKSALQVRGYGWNANRPISILTDFQEFAVYNCTLEPKSTDNTQVGLIKYLSYDQYLDNQNFDFLWSYFMKENVEKKSLEQLVKSEGYLKGSITVDKHFLNSLNRWRELLALGIKKSNSNIDEFTLNYLVQQTLDRILFLRICEARNIESPQSLYNKVVGVNNAYDNLVKYYFEADKKYNSGLFDFKQDVISPKIQIDNFTLVSIINEIYPPYSPYRFDVIPVEIIGNAYEQFLGNEIRIERNKVIIEQKPEVRKAGGVYYTPQYIVNYIVEKTVGKQIVGKTPEQIAKIKILDPSCGSGSFLLGAYQFLIDYHLDYYFKNKNKLKNIPVGDDGKLTTTEKKRILNNNIFGVDLDERAVEIAKLSLLLKVLEDETSETLADERLLGFKEKILPNLDMNIKCGNSLIGSDFKKVTPSVSKVEIEEIKPFDWQVMFPQVFKQGGFDAVIGNPPYVQSREGQLGEASKHYYYKTYKTAEYQLNTFGLFMEKSLTTLLKDKCVLGFIIPNYWLSTQYDKKLRKFMFQQNKTNEIINVYKVFESAVVDTLIIITEKQEIKTHGINVSSIDRNLKTIDQRLSAIRQNAWSYSEVKNVDFQSDDIEISFNKTFKLKGDATIGDYFDLKFGAKLYEVGKGNPVQTKAFSENGVYESDKRKDTTYKKLLKARSIKKHFIDWGYNWVKYGDNLAAPRTAELFMGERLLLQRIVSKDTLDVVFTDQEYICNTDVITLKPKNKTIPCKFFAGILGSFLCCKYIKSINVNLDRAAFPKINTNTLQDFPVPNLLNVKKNHVSQIVKLVESISEIKIDMVGSTDAREREKLIQKIAYTENAINEIVGELYDLTKEEIEIIEAN